MEIMGLQVSNTNGNSKQADRVRVYRDGVVIGEVFPTKRNPLEYIRSHKSSKYTRDLIGQLRDAGVSESAIVEICGSN